MKTVKNDSCKQCPTNEYKLGGQTSVDKTFELKHKQYIKQCLHRVTFLFYEMPKKDSIIYTEKKSNKKASILEVYWMRGYIPVNFIRELENDFEKTL